MCLCGAGAEMGVFVSGAEPEIGGDGAGARRGVCLHVRMGALEHVPFFMHVMSQLDFMTHQRMLELRHLLLIISNAYGGAQALFVLPALRVKLKPLVCMQPGWWELRSFRLLLPSILPGK